MKKYYNIFLITLTAFLFGACSNNDEPIIKKDDGAIEISFGVAKYKNNIATSRDTNDDTTEEQEVSNLYLFLFNEDGTALTKKYYIDNSTFLGGSWNEVNNVKLNLTQAEAGKSRVYLIANCDASLKNSLDDVSGGEADLIAIYNTADTPWSSTIGTPILMTGSKNHNFLDDPKLSGIELIRAVAKLEINLKLSAAHQSKPVIESEAQYKYKLIEFDKNTYLFKPSPKGDNLASSNDWIDWGDAVATYKIENEKVVSLKVLTYLNERDQAGTTVEIALPYNGNGPLPPPEFGPELYKVFLPDVIQRNTWYKYDIEI